MASSLKKLTGMGGDVRKIAALLQSKAPKGHKLAYINDEEAALLKSRGGSGKPHADTGIPSYELDDSLALQGGSTGGPSEVAPTAQSYGDTMSNNYSGAYAAPSAASFGIQPYGLQSPTQLTAGTGGGLGTAGAPTTIETPNISVPVSPRYNLASGAAGPTGGFDTTASAAPEKPSFTDKLTTSLTSPDALARLGIAGVTGILGSRQAQKAAESGRAGAAQLQGLATPYQQKGQELQAAAQRGELTPQAQQSLQAVQAQAAQGAERRGGVGAQQVAAQVEAFRQQLLAQQYDYGLKLSGIGDNIAMGAIKTGLQADQYVNQLTNQYYGNIARVAFGSAPQVAGTPATPGA